MRKIKRTARFKRDYRRELSSVLGKKLEELLKPVIELLAQDKPLPQRYSDHALAGDWKNYRDCHIRPDLVLIYRLVGTDTLALVRLGSHSELGL